MTVDIRVKWLRVGQGQTIDRRGRITVLFDRSQI